MRGWGAQLSAGAQHIHARWRSEGTGWGRGPLTLAEGRQAACRTGGQSPPIGQERAGLGQVGGHHVHLLQVLTNHHRPRGLKDRTVSLAVLEAGCWGPGTGGLVPRGLSPECVDTTFSLCPLPVPLHASVFCSSPRDTNWTGLAPQVTSL